MNEPLRLILAGIVGGLIGSVFFGGLWWTVRRGLSSPHPALWFIGSTLVRMSVAVGGFYIVGRDHWQQFLACLFGFVIARMIVIRLTGSPLAPQTSSRKEVHDAS